jgi:Uma2 family endonuclease
MATSSAVPVEEYLRTTYHPDMEYLEGQLVERHVGEYFHSRLQSLIAAALGSRERDRRYRVFLAQRVKVSDRPRYRIPDICVKALPHQITPSLLRPDLAIEVVSPDDQATEMLAKNRRLSCSGNSAHLASRSLQTHACRSRSERHPAA